MDRVNCRLDRDLDIMSTLSLADYGWSPFFQSQLSLEDLETLVPVRVTAAHRGAVDAEGPDGARRVQLPATEMPEEDVPTVGDWILITPDSGLLVRVLERASLFKRKAAGTALATQLIAANVDTLFIVTSCNQDFNLARLERYLVLAGEASVLPLIVLTKADLCDDAERYVAEARELQKNLLVEAVNAKSEEAKTTLLPWCGVGQTVAVLGSSGVGKSTLLNTLSGATVQSTQDIRQNDAKGRHTTTGRSLHRLPSGGWLIDTPGMRELQMTEVEQGLGHVFADILDLAAQCHFSDCKHESEPGCAVNAAIAAGQLDGVRTARYKKLAAEDARNSENLMERRARDKKFGKLIKSVKEQRKAKRKQ